jgi:PhnB protein
MAVNPIPSGYHTVTPYLIVDGAERLIDFAKQTFGATEIFRMPGEAGKIMHAEIKIGDSMVMLSDGSESHPPQPTLLHVYVKNCDETYRKALAAGAKSMREPADQFYGDRSATVLDPTGISWSIGTHFEDVSEAEMEKRMAEAATG